MSGNYNPYDYSENFAFNPFTLGTFNGGHPLMAGVTSLNSDFQNIVTPAAGATEVAATNLATSLVAFRPVSGGHTTVGVTAYVGADATQSGDWGKVIVNAGNWLCGGGGTPTPTPTATARLRHQRLLLLQLQRRRLQRLQDLLQHLGRVRLHTRARVRDWWL